MLSQRLLNWQRIDHTVQLTTVITQLAHIIEHNHLFGTKASDVIGFISRCGESIHIRTFGHCEFHCQMTQLTITSLCIFLKTSTSKMLLLCFALA